MSKVPSSLPVAASEVDSTPAGSPGAAALTGLDRSGARRESQRFLKFLVVGGFSFVVDTGSLSALVLWFDTNRILAKAIAFSLAVLSNFVWNRYWIYPESRSKPWFKQLLQFCLMSVVGFVINMSVFALVDRLATEPLGHVLALYLAQAMAVGAALFWNFTANRLITYGDVKLGR